MIVLARRVFYDVIFAGVLVLIVTNIAFAVLCTYWFYQASGETIHQRKLLTPAVMVGGNLRIEVDIERTSTCDSTLYRSVIDSKKTPWEREPERRTNYEGHTHFVQYIGIPLGAAAGPAWYKVRQAWKCNPLQAYWPRVEELPVIEFIIVRPITPGSLQDSIR